MGVEGSDDNDECDDNDESDEGNHNQFVPPSDQEILRIAARFAEVERSLQRPFGQSIEKMARLTNTTGEALRRMVASAEQASDLTANQLSQLTNEMSRLSESVDRTISTAMPRLTFMEYERQIERWIEASSAPERGIGEVLRKQAELMDWHYSDLTSTLSKTSDLLASVRSQIDRMPLTEVAESAMWRTAATEFSTEFQESADTFANLSSETDPALWTETAEDSAEELAAEVCASFFVRLEAAFRGLPPDDRRALALIVGYGIGGPVVAVVLSGLILTFGPEFGVLMMFQLFLSRSALPGWNSFPTED